MLLLARLLRVSRSIGVWFNRRALFVIFVGVLFLIPLPNLKKVTQYTTKFQNDLWSLSSVQIWAIESRYNESLSDPAVNDRTAAS